MLCPICEGEMEDMEDGTWLCDRCGEKVKVNEN